VNDRNPIIKGFAFLASLALGLLGFWMFFRGIIVSFTNPIFDTFLMPLTFFWNPSVATQLCLGYLPAILLISIARYLIHISGIWPMENTNPSYQIDE
jgi:hypothetical protein